MSPWESNFDNYETKNVTYDGENFETATFQTLFGTFFFLSNTRVEHVREVNNVLQLLSNFGGLY